MQYVRSISGSVSKTWNSINPATLSGAIDVIVVEHEDGSLSCSPFHVRFGKFSLLRPSEKKVEFQVRDITQDYAMKLGEGGEAFFVFETTADVPENLQTSPLVSPEASPEAKPAPPPADLSIQDPEPLDLDDGSTSLDSRRSKATLESMPILIPERRTQSDMETFELSKSFPNNHPSHPISRLRASTINASNLHNFPQDGLIPSLSVEDPSDLRSKRLDLETISSALDPKNQDDPESLQLLPPKDAVKRAITLSKKLWSSNIPSHVTDNGDLMLDMTGYKSTEEDMLQAEVLARKILSEELEGNYDIGSLISPDVNGNIWIYSSEESKEAAAQKTGLSVLEPRGMVSTDALSDPGYHSDDVESQKNVNLVEQTERAESDSAVGLTTPPQSPNLDSISESSVEPNRNYAKTLRLTSDQLKALNLESGPNPMSFSVNRATCQAYLYLWKYNTPIVISDIDGTITKSDALGHVLNMIGRDWTHLGVAKLYSDIVANGYNILYLTSRSVGQADTTRTYISGIVQEGYKLPKGPVIMSPDRTMAALRREIYLRKPEVFKMACLRDIMSLFNQRKTPFYAGFGNRLTDALSYRSVNIPSTRIFTINSNAEVSLDLMSLSKYKTGYGSMREIVDHFFPPIGMLVQEGGEQYTDFNYWREPPRDLDEFSESESDEDGNQLNSIASDEDDDDIFSDDLNDSHLSRDSFDDSMSQRLRQSLESDNGRRVIRINSQEVRLQEASDEDDVDDEDALDLVAEVAAEGRPSSGRTSNRKTLQKELDDYRPHGKGVGRQRGSSNIS